VCCVVCVVVVCCVVVRILCVVVVVVGVLCVLFFAKLLDAADVLSELLVVVFQRESEGSVVPILPAPSVVWLPRRVESVP